MKPAPHIHDACKDVTGLARVVIDLSYENERLQHNITVWADTLRDVKREAHKVIDDLSDKLDEVRRQNNDLQQRNTELVERLRERDH